MTSHGAGRALTYYVYALKDPRASPARPFYIGKGTGDRAQQHLITSGRSRKDQVIEAIRAAGREPLVEVLVNELEEAQALRIEAELISAFGTEARGGLLTNVVAPSGERDLRTGITVPSGAFERAQIGLKLCLDAVVGVVRANPGSGVTNADVVHALGLGSDHDGGSKDYLSYSLLGLLMREGRVVKKKEDSTYRPPGM